MSPLRVNLAISFERSDTPSNYDIFSIGFKRPDCEVRAETNYQIGSSLHSTQERRLKWKVLKNNGEPKAVDNIALKLEVANSIDLTAEVHNQTIRNGMLVTDKKTVSMACVARPNLETGKLYLIKIKQVIQDELMAVFTEIETKQPQPPTGINSSDSHLEYDDLSTEMLRKMYIERGSALDASQESFNSSCDRETMLSHLKQSHKISKIYKQVSSGIVSLAISYAGSDRLSAFGIAAIGFKHPDFEIEAPTDCPIIPISPSTEEKRLKWNIFKANSDMPEVLDIIDLNSEIANSIKLTARAFKTTLEANVASIDRQFIPIDCEGCPQLESGKLYLIKIKQIVGDQLKSVFTEYPVSLEK